jgi:hypothetical protein
MNPEEIELFKSMLAMLKDAGNASIWLIIAWWGYSLVEIVLIGGFIVGTIAFTIKKIFHSVSWASQGEEWCTLAGKNKYSGEKYTQALITQLLQKHKTDNAR